MNFEIETPTIKHNLAESKLGRVIFCLVINANKLLAGFFTVKKDPLLMRLITTRKQKRFTHMCATR